MPRITTAIGPHLRFASAQKLASAAVIAILVLLAGCDTSAPIDSVAELTATVDSIGFAGRSIQAMTVDNGKLYVAAGPDGLWRLDLRKEPAEWEYLGLADENAGRDIRTGVLDVEVEGDQIFVAYDSEYRASNRPPESEPFSETAVDEVVSVWASSDGGKHWARSDNGIAEIRVDDILHASIYSIARSPHRPEVLLSFRAPALFRSADGGRMWTQLRGFGDVNSTGGQIRWNPFKPGEAWLYGHSTRGVPFLFSVTAYGAQRGIQADFTALGLPAFASIADLAFDAGSSNRMYASMTHQGNSPTIFRSLDGGTTWAPVTSTGGNDLWLLKEDPRQPGLVFLAGENSVYYSIDGLESGKPLAPIPGSAKTMAYDAEARHLYLATSSSGLFRLRIY